jgi:hypothetical protein
MKETFYLLKIFSNLIIKIQLIITIFGAMHPAVNNVPRRESLLGIILHPGNPFGNNILSRDSLQGIFACLFFYL